MREEPRAHDHVCGDWTDMRGVGHCRLWGQFEEVVFGDEFVDLHHEQRFVVSPG